MGELWGVCFEDFEHNLPRYNGAALYFVSWHGNPVSKYDVYKHLLMTAHGGTGHNDLRMISMASAEQLPEPIGAYS